MAISSLCAVNGCGNHRTRREWCDMHYRRWLRHGDPLAGRTPNGEQWDYINTVAVSHTGNDCLIWPYSRHDNGYATVNNPDGTGIVARIVCERVHGAPPDPSMVSAHECGKGHLGCISPLHLSWKTHAQNAEDMIRHGTSPKGERHGMVKLTECDVHQIRALRGKKLHREIAYQYGIDASLVSMIQNRKSWAWLE